MDRIIILILLLTVSVLNGYSQYTITGSFPHLGGQEVKLTGFNGFDIYTIDASKVSGSGVFQLKYSARDRGMGYLSAGDNRPYFVVLADENISLEGESLALPQTVKMTSGSENQIFGQYAVEHPKREQALSAWTFLHRIYKEDPLFALQRQVMDNIEMEISRIKNEDAGFLSNLDPDSYVSWYLPTRKLVSSVSTIAQFRTEEIPATIAAFRALDHTDNRLFKSGLYKDAIESHFWLLENSGRLLDSVYAEMKISIDHLVDNLLIDEDKLNSITTYLFNLLERHSLFEASEYLALKILNETSCTLNDDLAKQLESYRAMKKGNIAPDIVFRTDTYAPGYSAVNMPQKLSDLSNDYFVVVFGASWCPQCVNEIHQIASHYSNWKKNGVEVVFISLDDDKSAFIKFAGSFPFISTCDYKKWNATSAQDYHIFATPTMYLLDSKREILLRPNSVKQIDAWVDWFLVKGNS